MTSPLTNELFDVVVIGAGVVGCAVARRFALDGARVLTLEKGRELLSGASKANSAILHTGFDAPTGSLEHQCLIDGYQEYLSIRAQFDLPIKTTGALVIAWQADEEDRLDTILAQAQDNGVTDGVLLNDSAIRRLEPNLAGHARAGVSIPGESIIDPWTTPYLYQLQALKHGAEIIRDCEVTCGDYDNGQWTLSTNQGQFRGRLVINCGGLYGDIVDQRLVGKSTFEIRPRKGQFLIYEKAASALLNHIVLPIPTAFTKGLVICPTIFGNLLVGPTAEEQLSRDEAAVDRVSLKKMQQQAHKMLPELAGYQVTATYAGLRPATQFKDYCISFDPQHHYVTVGGIRSTGLSAALGIAKHVAHRVQSEARESLKPHPNRWQIEWTPPESIIWPKAHSLSEYDQRDWQQPGQGGIICHCERVTRREIEAALQGPLAARSLAGLKRRTRVTMGSCQGFYCSAELANITNNHFTSAIGKPIDDLEPHNEAHNQSKAQCTGSANPLENSLDTHWDVVIVGAGPSGLSAATKLKEYGVANVAVLEREPNSGGIPRHCAHSPFGLGEFKRLYTGPNYAKRLTDEATKAGVQIFCGTTVSAILKNNRLQISDQMGLKKIYAKKILLAMGNRETPRSTRLIGGPRPLGIMTTGALQSMVHLKRLRPFSRPVIIGSELVGFSAAITCRQAGIKPVAMLESANRPTAWRGSQWLLKMLGIPFLTETNLISINGQDRVQSINVEGPKGRYTIPCDGVLFSGKFTAETGIIRSSHLQLDPLSSGPITDQYGRCSDPNIFAVGNLCHPVDTAGWCWREGQAIAQHINSDLNQSPDPSCSTKSNPIPITAPAWEIRYLTPQIIRIPVGQHNQPIVIQLRLNTSVNSRVSVIAQPFEQLIVKQKIRSRSERRVLVTIPPLNTHLNEHQLESLSSLTLALE